MQFGKIASSVAALALVSAPVMAEAASTERASQPATGESEMSSHVLWILLAIAAVIAAIVVFDGNDDPVSP